MDNDSIVGLFDDGLISSIGSLELLQNDEEFRKAVEAIIKRHEPAETANEKPNERNDQLDPGT